MSWVRFGRVALVRVFTVVASAGLVVAGSWGRGAGEGWAFGAGIASRVIRTLMRNIDLVFDGVQWA
jgi:hypothetical protein